MELLGLQHHSAPHLPLDHLQVRLVLHPALVKASLLGERLLRPVLLQLPQPLELRLLVPQQRRLIQHLEHQVLAPLVRLP